MAGVLPEYRDRKIGRLLKLEQRRLALAAGIRLVEWTFDPLEIRNAWFNIERLGAVVRRYVLNQYGVTTSILHAGLPTDRCVAEWYLSIRRASRRAQRRSRRNRGKFEARISVPATIDDVRRDDPKRSPRYPGTRLRISSSTPPFAGLQSSDLKNRRNPARIY
jgi:predicted GNAT superfamily acetyltransferase